MPRLYQFGDVRVLVSDRFTCSIIVGSKICWVFGQSFVDTAVLATFHRSSPDYPAHLILQQPFEVDVGKVNADMGLSLIEWPWLDIAKVEDG